MRGSDMRVSTVAGYLDGGYPVVVLAVSQTTLVWKTT